MDRKRYSISLTARVIIACGIVMDIVMVVLLFMVDGQIFYRAAGAVFAAVSVVIAYYEYKKIYLPLKKTEEFVNSTTASLIPEENEEDENNDIEDIDMLLNAVKSSIDQAYSIELSRTRAEMSALQSQVNPHFLYNTLEGMRSLSLKNGSKEVAEMTEALANMFRYSINGTSDMVSIRQELQNVDSYLLIQKYRFPDKFEVDIIVDSDEDYSYKIPMLSLQPLVENSIHHGLETMMGKGIITIRIFHTQCKMMVIVRDNGKGMSQDQLDELNRKLAVGNELRFDSILGKHSHNTLVNVNRRLNYYYGGSYGLHVYSIENGGTTVEMVLPYMDDND